MSDNENYAGFIIPPIPVKADISETRIKFARLDELEGTMNREEFERLKEQVTEEYLAIFKKTVSDHEVHFQIVFSLVEISTSSLANSR